MRVENINNKFVVQSFGIRGEKNIKNNTKKIKQNVKQVVKIIDNIQNKNIKTQYKRNRKDDGDQLWEENNYIYKKKVKKVIKEVFDNNEVKNTLSKDVQDSQKIQTNQQIQGFSPENYFYNHKVDLAKTINTFPIYKPVTIFDNIKKSIEQEFIKNEILENREDQLQKGLVCSDDLIKNYQKRNQILIFFKKFFDIIKVSDNPKLKQMTTQIMEILNLENVLVNFVIKPTHNLYKDISIKREQNPMYEVSQESFNDNNNLINIMQNAKWINRNIVDTLNCNKMKTAIKDAKEVFGGDINKQIKTIVKDLSDFHNSNNALLESELDYRSKYINLINNFILCDNLDDDSLNNETTLYDFDDLQALDESFELELDNLNLYPNYNK